jgi:U6 snRNA-associated Sm-like protein LSm1
MSGTLFADVPLGLYVVRGENVVWMGRLDPAADAEGPPGVARAPEADVRRAAKAEREADKLKRGMKARMDFLDLE